MQAVEAVNAFNGEEIAGRKILVREDREDRDVKQYNKENGIERPNTRRPKRGGRGGGGANGTGRGDQGGRGAAPQETHQSSGLQASTLSSKYLPSACWACPSGKVNVSQDCAVTLFVMRASMGTLSRRPTNPAVSRQAPTWWKTCAKHIQSNSSAGLPHKHVVWMSTGPCLHMRTGVHPG